jgi:hypothetical protein
MKTKTIKTLMVAAITLAAMSVPSTANAQLGGLVKKAKEKAKEKVEQVVDKKKNEVVEKGKEKAKEVKNDATFKALNSQRPEMPWIMGRTARFAYSDDELNAFVNEGLGKLSEDEVKDLREKLFARYKNNLMLQTAMKEGGIDDYHLSESLRNEQEMFHIFYDLLESKVTHSSVGMINESLNLDSESATFKYERPSFTIPAGNALCSAVKGASGQVVFRKMVGGDKIFLKGDALQQAKDYIQLFRNIFTVSQSIGNFSKEVGEEPERHGFLPFRTLEWLSRMNAAMANNTVENIEFKAMPKAGSMQAKYKAEALAIAKADDPKVIDVVITSNDWDVLMKGLVPERRNIYGYYITQDELGKICSERVWTQKYQGNGNYGKLKAGGVGVSADFYVK